MQPFKTQLNGPKMMNHNGNYYYLSDNLNKYLFFLANSSDLITSSPNSSRYVKFIV